MRPYTICRHALSASFAFGFWVDFIGLKLRNTGLPLGDRKNKVQSITSINEHGEKQDGNEPSYLSTQSTFMVLALASLTKSELDSATSGLNDYGIPYELVQVPNGAATLPPLNSSATSGNYGGIVVLSELSYSFTNSDGSSSWTSALTSNQWISLYEYQSAFGVRMVRLAGFPSNSPGTQDSGTESLGGCCDLNVENFMTVHDTSQFPTAGLVQ